MRGSPELEVERYLRTGESDPVFGAWPGASLLERAVQGEAALRDALVAEIDRRTASSSDPVGLADLDVPALTRRKVTPMVRGLFPGREQEAVLDLLGRSVVFLTPSSIATVLGGTRFPHTAWALANLYLASCGAELLSDDAPLIVGLSEETTCYVSTEYLRSTDAFADFLVHEAAHVFHNCKRRMAGLSETRTREWLLLIDFRKRETFAHACEAFSRVLEIGTNPSSRRRLLEENLEAMPGSDRPDAAEIQDILREAVTARNGWKRILDRCSPHLPPV